MAAYMIAHVTVKNAEKLPEYSSQAGPTFAPFGGAPVARGKVVEVLTGTHAGHAALIVKFPDAQSARDWYNSPAYQALSPLRDEAIDATFVLIEEA